MFYGLQKIIILDSFLPGKRILMNVDGHTNLNGTNASGKTTTLRLVRLFYGETPTDICRRKGSVKDAFVSYYLPRRSSYIIFEYRNHDSNGFDGVKHVACFSRNDGINYLLVDKPFELTDYARIDEQQQVDPIPCTDILREHRNKGYTIKPLSAPSHYRKIILGTVKASERDLMPHRLKFSLAQPGKNLAHLDKVVATTLEKNRDFDNIKLMLSSVMLDGHSDVVDFKIDASDLEKWRADSAAIRSYEKYQGKLQALQQQLSQYQSSLVELQTAKFSLRHYFEQFSLQRQQSQSEKAQLEQQIDDDASQYTEQRDQLNEQISELNVEINTLTRQIEQLDNEKLKWEEQGIGQLKSDLSALPSKKSELKHAQEQLELLLDMTDDINQQFDQLKQKIQADFYKNSDKLQEQLNQATAQKASRELAFVEQKAALNQKFSQLKTERTQQFAEQLTDAEKQLAVLQSQVRQQQANENTQAAIDGVEQDISEANRQSKTLLQQLSEKTKQNNALLNQRRLAEQDHRDRSKTLAKYQDQKAALEKQLEPEAGSLRAFLTEHIDQWSTTIGKVIKTPLLDSKNLKPQLQANEHDASPHNNSSFYGLTLDLSGLTDEHNKTVDALHSEINQLEHAIIAEQQGLTSSEGRFGQINQQVDQLALEITQLNANLNNKESLTTQLNEQLKQLKQQRANEIKDKQQRLEKDLKAAEQHFQQVKQVKADNMRQLDLRHREENNDLMAGHSADLSDIEELIDGLSEHLEQLKLQQKTQLKQLDKDRNLKLSDKQVDVKRLADIERDIKQLKAFISRLDGAEDKVQRYEGWEKTSYSQLAPQQQQLSQQRDQRELLTNQRQQLEQHFKQSKTLLKAQLDNCKQAAKEAGNRLADIEPLFSRLTDIEPIDPQAAQQSEVNILNFSALMGHVSEHLEYKHRSAEHINKQVNRFMGVLKDHYSSQLYRAINEADSQVTEKHDDHHRIHLAHYIVNELPAMVSDIKSHVINLANVRGLALSTLYSQLDNQRQIIIHFGRELNHTIQAKTLFSALSQINVYLEPVVDKLDFFKDLQLFKTEFEKWRGDDMTALPDQHFELLLTQVLERFRANRMTTKHSSLYDIVFEAEVNGKIAQARTASELEDISSQGMGYLILLALMISVGSMIKNQQPISVHYPVDELGEIHLDNIKAMFDILNAEQDILVSALPNSDKNLLNMYRNRYRIDRKNNCFETTIVSSDPVLALAKKHQANPALSSPVEVLLTPSGVN